VTHDEYRCNFFDCERLVKHLVLSGCGVSNELLTNGGETLLNWLLYFINACLANNVFPKMWQLAAIIAILKPARQVPAPRATVRYHCYALHSNFLKSVSFTELTLSLTRYFQPNKQVFVQINGRPSLSPDSKHRAGIPRPTSSWLSISRPQSGIRHCLAQST